MIDPAARARLERWKLSLLDLSTGNRLLDASKARTRIPLPDVDVLRLAAGIAGGSAYSFEAFAPGDPRPSDPQRLSVPLLRVELERRLTAIRRAARAQLADGGVHTMWLALGLLHWCDADGVAHPAPLWLVPVELERSEDGALRLVGSDAVEPRFNQTLGEKLRRELGILLEPAADDVDLAALLQAAEGIAVTRPGWRLERAALLGVFSFAKFVMWNDLDARADELLASPVIAHVAAARAPAGTPAFEQPSESAAAAIARASDPAAAIAADLLCPLDADASQLAAVAAAGAGASFVLQGPPGTGKSQTIANLIVHCVSQGKTVLFVTDKIAALDVVNQRLAAVGLGDFCLELHSHKASRAQVLGQLGRVLERSFRPGSGPMGEDARLAELRAALDGYAAALHHAGPFGRSVHEVLGRLVELRDAPRAPLAERDVVGLDAAAFEKRRLAVAELAAAAIPVEPVASHPWRRSTLERWPLDGRERVGAALVEAAASSAALADAVREIAALVPGIAARTRDQLQALGALAALAVASPRPGAELLTQLRAARGDDIAEQIALIRAKGGGTLEAPRDPLAVLQLATRHRALADEVRLRWTERVADLDARALWQQLKRWANSVGPVRFVALRGARAQIRAAAIPGQLEDDAAILPALEAVIAERAVRAALRAAAEPAARWFGELGGDPLALELGQIDAAVAWAASLRKAFDAVEVGGGEPGRAAAWRALVAQVAVDRSQGDGSIGELAPFGRLADAVARWTPALAALGEATGIDVRAIELDEHARGGDVLARTPDERSEAGGWGPTGSARGAGVLPRVIEHVESLRHAIDSLRDWVAFHAARRAAAAAGVGPAVAAIERGELGAAELARAGEGATLLAWADAELADTPALARFHGPSHHAHVAAFADLDRAALALVRSRALGRLAERVPRVTTDPGGELGVLMHELKKQRGHRPLRRLFAEIPALLPRLAPCMLMSPQSVAQYLDPAAFGASRFDIVVFDEASQLPTADAIGALARGDSVVVVGDGKQLPPTRFFEAGEAVDSDDDAAASAELESVLDECVAARLPELRLGWHYRSKHQDLIAFANQRYYGDRLQVFPAPHASPDLGISWRRVDGVYDRAGTRQNRIEAEAVVAEVIARLKDSAQCTRSIAVVTFSRAQQELIEDLLDEARAADSALDAVMELLGRGGFAATEPLIVKNLETVQGDERDLVLISVGYGPDASGAFTMQFGPLSQRGGERRLNVAITRAREQLVIFSSFGPEDIADTATGAARDLAALLVFARDHAERARPAEELPPASPITAAIASALVERGWIVRHQVGCGAFKVDLAVVDPNDPDRYVLAIEHDGAAYASAPAARDRDRLRAQVLAQLGWRLHRIWSLDWWADPEREIARAHAAIVTALAASRQRRTGPVKARSARPSPAPRGAQGSSPTAAAPKRTPRPQPAIAAGSGPSTAEHASTEIVLSLGDDATTPVRVARGGIAIGPYTVAAIPAGRRVPDDLFAPRHLPELGKIVEQVLAAEAPMHVDLLARRVGAYFGIGRVTQRVTDQIRVALAGRGRWGAEHDFVWRMDQDPAGMPPVRVAGSGPAARREIHEVPLSEVAAAVRIVVERAVGIGQRDLVRDAARLLGFSRITERVTERIAHGLALAEHRELIRVENGRASLPLD